MVKSHYVWLVEADAGTSPNFDSAYGYGEGFSLFVPFGNGVLVGNQKDAETLRHECIAAWRARECNPGEYDITRVPIIALAVLGREAYSTVIGMDVIAVGDRIPNSAWKDALKYFDEVVRICMISKGLFAEIASSMAVWKLTADVDRAYAEMMVGGYRYPSPEGEKS